MDADLGLVQARVQVERPRTRNRRDLERLVPQSDLLLLRSRGVPVPVAVVAEADRVDGLVYGLLRAESSSP